MTTSSPPAKKQSSPKKAATDLLKCKTSVEYFIDSFCYIQDENTGSYGRFRLWDFQRELLQEWLQYRLNIDLKARQLGISWLACAFALWLANFHENITILLISKTEYKAHDLIRKIKFMYDLLPPFLRKELLRDNAGSLVWKGETTTQGSRIIALASTPGAGVGYTATLIICDEWGEQEYAEELYSSYKPTIDMGGRFIGIGTGNQVGSFYHEVWKQARQGINGFFAHFLSWSLRPGRDQDWYERTKASYPNPQEFYRQYPSNEVEAFIAAGGCPFKLEDIEWYMDTYVEPPLENVAAEFPQIAEKFLETGELQVWEKPVVGFPYAITFDQATGQVDGDFHAFHVIKLSNMEQVAEFQSRCDTDVACQLALELCYYYGTALLIWESTGVGHAATNIFVRSGYPNLYEHESFEQERRNALKPRRSDASRRLGWPASRQANYARDADIIAGIREHTIIVHSERWFDEAKGFVRQPDGSYGASGRAHDDLITSLAMGYHVALRTMHRISPATRPTKSYRTRRKFSREKWR